jgi:glycosyltransferase involved in cell wall biosynthesis
MAATFEGITAMSRRDQYNPPLFQFDPVQAYPWRVFDRITVATVTFNRIEYTRKFLNALERYAQMPFELLVIENASEDGSREMLRELAPQWPHLRVVENRRNVGMNRALLQIRDIVQDGMVVLTNIDIEILSNYFLVHLQKAFHAARLNLGTSDVGFGVRLLNCEEYGFRFATRHQTLPIPADSNAQPRTSYAAVSKDDSRTNRLLDEEVVVGWSDFLLGPTILPVSVFKQFRLEDLYPLMIGGDDAFMSAEMKRLGVLFGYIENGPVARHNDWPYSEDKIAFYESIATKRAVTDVHYLRWKLKRTMRRFGWH